MRKLVLASQSPRRLQLLREAGYQPEVVLPEVDELHSDHLTAEELTCFNAHRKAVAVARRYPEAVVLGADTLVMLEQRIFGKPKTLTEAKEMLTLLSGKVHEVFTAASMIQLRERKVFTEAVSSEVRFRTLDPATIDRYLSLVQPLDKAGAYAAQEAPESVIEKVEGSLTNVIGLPMELVLEMLPWFGIVPGAPPD